MKLNLKKVERKAQRAMQQMLELNNLKQSLYCFMCDGDHTESINLSDKKLVFSNLFCRKLIKNNWELIKFIHIELVEYAEQIHQYTQCF